MPRVSGDLSTSKPPRPRAPRTAVSCSRWQQCLAVCTLFVITPLHAYPSAERLGLVSGTWEACRQEVALLEVRLERISKDSASDPRLKAYLERRFVTEMDRCIQLRDAPLSATLEVMRRYRDLGMGARALDIGLRTLNRVADNHDILLITASLLYERGQIESALTMSNRVIAIQPTSLEANRFLGAYHYERGNFSSAIPYLTVVANAIPSNFEGNAALGDSCLKANDLMCATKYLGRASKIRQDDALLALRVGDLESKRKNYLEAISHYTRAVAADPTRSEAHLGLGRAYIALSLYENAQASLVRATELQANNLEATISAARVLRRLKRPEFAAALVQRMLDAEIRSNELYVERGLSLILMGRPQQALLELNQWTARGNNDERVLLVKGDALLQLSESEKALGVYRKIAADRPKQPEYQVRIVRALRHANRSAEALQLLDDLGELTGAEPLLSELVQTLVDRAAEEADNGRLEDANRLLTRANNLAPDNARVNLAYSALRATVQELATPVVADPDASQRAVRLVQAWSAYAAKDYQGVIQLLNDHTRDERESLLTGASFFHLGNFDAAWDIIKEYAGKNGVSTSWLAAVWAGSADAKLRSGMLEEAQAHLNFGIPRQDLPKDFNAWVSRTTQVLYAALGHKTELLALDGHPNQAAAPIEVDRALTALQLGWNEQWQQALHALPRSAAHGPVGWLRDRFVLELAMSHFRAKRHVDAEKWVKEIRAIENLSTAELIDTYIIKYSRDPQKLLSAVADFSSNRELPERLFVQAMTTERITQNGQESIDFLKQLASTENATGSALDCVTKARQLLELKHALY